MPSDQPSADVAVRAAASHSRVLRPEPRLLGRHTLSLRLGSTMAPTSSDENSKSDTDLQFRVELRGFEPLTPSMRTRCATGLRHSPWTGSQPSKLRASSAPRRSAGRNRGTGAASVADRARCCVGVLIVELVADPVGDVDDLGRRLGSRGGPCFPAALAGGADPKGRVFRPPAHLLGISEGSLAEEEEIHAEHSSWWDARPPGH